MKIEGTLGAKLGKFGDVLTLSPLLEGRTRITRGRDTMSYEDFW